MDKKTHQRKSSHWKKLKNIRQFIMTSEDESKRKPKFSTSTSGWVTDNGLGTRDLTLNHSFLGIKMKVSRESLTNYNPCAVKFRINNSPTYEPTLEGSDHRVYDVIQILPKELIFSPPAELTLRLPSCVHKKTAGQIVCMFGNSYGLRNDVRYLKWGRLSSYLFIVNSQRTEAKVICKCSGFYTLVLTQCPEVTSQISPERPLTFNLQDIPGIKVSCGEKTVQTEAKITIKVVRLEDLYSSPSASPMSPHRRRFPIEYRHETNEEMVDVTGSPVVLIRPIRTRFGKPVRLSLPLLGDEFDGFFDQESNRLVVLWSRELDDDSIIWNHHYSTPEISFTASGKKTATFLVTSGGLFKVVRRFSNKHMRTIEKVSSRISRELCNDIPSDVMVTLQLKGHITEIAEPGKQFVLRISLLDASQPTNPDSCFLYEVCSQSITVPLGKIRLLVRGRFEPDRDAADHSEERTVVFTGKTLLIDFHMKLRLSDPTKLPEQIGKVTVHSSTDIQYFIDLKKPIPIPRKALNDADEGGRRKCIARPRNGTRPLVRRHTVSSVSKQENSITETSIEEDENEEDQIRMRLQRSGYAARSASNLLGTIDTESTNKECTEPTNSSSSRSGQIDKESNGDWSEYSDVLNDENEEKINDWSDSNASYDDIAEVQNANLNQLDDYDDWSDSNDVNDSNAKVSNEDRNNNIIEKGYDWSTSNDIIEKGPMVESFGVVIEGYSGEKEKRGSDSRSSFTSSSISFYDQEEK